MPPTVKRRVITFLLAALGVWLSVVAVTVTLRSRWASSQLDQANSAMADQERSNDRLGQELTRMHSPDWLALMARAQLNYKLPDEQVVFVYKNEKSGILAQPATTPVPRSHAARWWDWLRGK